MYFNFAFSLDISSVFAILRMQEARRKPARHPKILSYVAVVPGQEWDGYIAFGVKKANNTNTASRITRKTRALIIFFPNRINPPSSR